MDLTTPLRTTGRILISTARTGVRAASQTGSALLGRLRDGDEEPRPTAQRPQGEPSPTEVVETADRRRTEEPAPAAPAPPVAAGPAPEREQLEQPEQPEFQPAHLDIEPAAVVYSSADPGAQDGAGAALHVDEPWDGYRGMKAADVIDRLVVADPATLAQVQLYEQSHRARSTVLAAVGRQLSTDA